MNREEGIERAVALLYDGRSGSAPKVVASGRGEVAARILETARRAGVQVVEDRDFLEPLSRIPVGKEIPGELYQAVAEILAFVYRVNGRYKVKDLTQGEEGEGPEISKI